MNFNFTPEQGQFRDSVLRFSKKELAGEALERAHAAAYPWDVAKLMAKQRLIGITIPEPHGGQGGNLTDAEIPNAAVASAGPRSARVLQGGNFRPKPRLGRHDY